MVSEREEKKRHDYCRYDTMSTAELEQLLRLDFQASKDGESDLDAILYISALLTERNALEARAVDTAWERFNTKYRPFADGRSLYDFGDEDTAAPPKTRQMQVDASSERRSKFRWPRARGVRRVAILVALLTACLFGGMVAAQAAGMDVFGAVARWTDEVFQFVPASEGSQRVGSSAENEPIPFIHGRNL